MKKVMVGFVLLLFCLAIGSDSGLSQEILPVDGFGNHFADWKLKEFKGRADYQVQTRPRPVITLSTKGTNYMLIRELKDLDLREYPILIFEWMVEKHPVTGDLRRKETDDQAAGLYVTLPSFPELINFNTIGYVWENRAPVGVYPSLWSSNIKYVVLRSGADGLGHWQKERRNVVEDFKSLWGITINQKRKVVVCLAANSNNTKSASLASFGPMQFSKP
jgi:hypothetical protein